MSEEIYSRHKNRITRKKKGTLMVAVAGEVDHLGTQRWVRGERQE